MKINTMEIALAAQLYQESDKGPGLFGHFKAIDISNEQREMAFTADRYGYVGSPLCLHVWTCETGQEPFWEPYFSLTRNIRPNDCLEDEVVVKTYEENEHLRQPLLDLGYFKDTGKRIATGFVSLEIWTITPKFAEAFHAMLGVAEAA